jgi:hypothetical protein
MKNSDFSTAIKKIKEDIKLYGRSRNHLFEPLRKNGCTIQVTREEGDKEIVVEEYFVTPEEIQAQARLRECRHIRCDKST